MRTLVWIMLTLALTACGSAATPTATPTSGSATDESANTAPLVVYTMEGGGKDMKSVLTIEQNGAAHLMQEGLNRGAQDVVWNVPAPQLEQLKKVLSSTDFGDLKESYVPSNTCCDRIEYTVSLQGQTVKTLDGANNPPALAQAVDILSQIQAGAPK